MKARYFHPAIVALLLTCSATWAQDDTLNWNSLTDEQRQVLSPLEENWDTLSLERRQRLTEGAKRWSEMDAEDRSAARERFQNWRSLTEDQRSTIRDRYEQFQRLNPREKARIRDNFRRFRDLPADRRQQLLVEHLHVEPLAAGALGQEQAPVGEGEHEAVCVAAALLEPLDQGLGGRGGVERRDREALPLEDRRRVV